MKGNTSDWFGSLTTRERKDLVCLFFGLDLSKHRYFGLFQAFLRVLDDEYHSLK